MVQMKLNPKTNYKIKVRNEKSIKIKELINEIKKSSKL